MNGYSYCHLGELLHHVYVANDNVDEIVST